MYSLRPTIQAAPLQNLVSSVFRASIRFALLFVLRFAFREGASVWLRVLLPALIGGFALYFSLDLYLLQLERYLAHPSERIASLVLGIASAGLLLTLFMHSVAITTVSSAALGREDKGWSCFRVSRRAWRVFAAHLRFLVVCAALISVVIVLMQVADRTRWTTVGSLLDLLVIPGGLVYLCIRIGFLLAPIACADDHGPIIRAAWRLSYSSQGTIAVLVVLFLATGFGLELAGETIMKMIIPAAATMPAEPLSTLVANYRGVLWAPLLAMSVAYIPGLVLAGSAAAAVYKRVGALSRQ